MSETQEETYSYSRVTSFSQCPRSYKFRYVEKLREAFTSVEAHLGRAVHAALAWLYDAREGSKEPERAALLEKFDEEWGSGLGPRVRVIRNNDSLEARHEAGRRMLAAHHGGPFRSDPLTTVATEQSLWTRLEGKYRFRGIIDRLARDPEGGLHLVDYKTTGRPPALLDDERALQLRLYGMLALEHHGGERARLTYQYLANGQSLSEVCSRGDTPGLARRLAERIDEIESARDFPPHPSALCAWCGYRDICDASGDQAGGSKACPRCQGLLRRRSGRFGEFLGCENYPRCRYTRDA